MTNAPERIWRVDAYSEFAAMNHGIASWAERDQAGDNAVQYVRADLVPKWQPIETAPKDGTVIYVWYETGKSHVKLSTPQRKAYYSNGGWIIGGVGGVAEIQPTHWMPLQKGPNE